jgi:hypothetical protein
MKQTPILFSTPMVQAILEGRKTQTRRVVKNCSAKHLSMREKKAIGESGRNYKFPYGQVGDVLWVRETYLNFNSVDETPNYIYKADHPNFHVNFASGERWKPSIHMPKSACRIWLKITNVRVERLQKISEQDAMIEGVEILNVPAWKDYIDSFGYCESAYESFKTLWQSINSEESWNDNPWVWVIEFEQVNIDK